MVHAHRSELSKAIAAHIDKYDGVVVLHGTDTLAYSAASVSYMLVGVEKDVIFTGAQRPGFGASDFDRNFIRSIKGIIARLEQPKNRRVRAGVKVVFGDKLMLGSTVIKEDEHGINAFAPIEKHALAGRVGHQVDLYDISRDVTKRPFTLFTDFDIQVAYFECISAIDIQQFERYVENPDVSGILIGGYDEGNMPIQMKYYIATAVNSYNKPVAFVSNTDNGIAAPTLKGRNGEFIRAGAIALGDMIKESAFQKMCFAMGVANKQKDLEARDRLELVRQVMHTNLCGEISDVYCEMGDMIYKNIFTRRKFSKQELATYLEGVNEVKDVKKAPKFTGVPKNQGERKMPKKTKDQREVAFLVEEKTPAKDVV